VGQDITAGFYDAIINADGYSMQKAGVGIHGDGGGLALQVQPGARGVRKTWIFRYMIAGRARTMGLGTYPEVTLQRAREKAQECRRLKVEGIDPIEHKNAARESLRATKPQVPTFDECAAACMASRSQGWRSVRHGEAWVRSLRTYVSPVFGHVSIDVVDLAMVCQVLEPLWRTKCETASRVRGRIERVLAYATVRGLRSGPNPAVWRNNLDQILPSRQRVAPVKHFAALPYDALPDFLRMLRGRNGVAVRCLEFATLTACRASEARGCRWDEINGASWTIPAQRTKANRVHRVPLSTQALALISRMPRVNEYVFASIGGKQLSPVAFFSLLKRMGIQATTHGMRACFSTWARERTGFAREIIEASLAHHVGNAVERAYARTDLYERRAKLMQAWGDFCESPATGAEVIPLRA
jgi:integrase